MIRVNKRKGKKALSYSIPFKLQVLERIRQGEMSIFKASHKFKIGGHNTVYKWMKKYDQLFEKFEQMNKNSAPVEQEITVSQFRKIQKRMQLLEYVIDTMQDTVKELGGEAFLKKLSTQYLKRAKRIIKK